MATRLCIKRAKLFGRFQLHSVPRTLCIAAAEVEKQSRDDGQIKKKKEKDVAKMLMYKQYRENVLNAREIFRGEYEKKQAKERRRIEELNRGSFSPVEQHKKALEDIRKYNENKEIARRGRQEERREKMKINFEKQKASSDAEQRERNRDLVLKVIEESKSFVTMENLEEKIQEVLKTETNYNFALTGDRRKIVSKEPPNNLGMHGPGPAAYQSAGLKFKTKTKHEGWKMRQKIEDEIGETDSSDSSESDGETSVGDNGIGNNIER